MPGAFCRQFSIAVWPLAWSPAVSWLQTTWEALTWSLALWSTAAAPNPDRKPLWRSTPTVMPGARSSVAILTGLLPRAALAYLPISTPAWKLLVANSASTADCGSVGVSSAITSTPLSRAFWMEGTIALVSLGLMRIPLTPAATMFSMAVAWLALSPSNLPAAVSSLAPLAAAACAAPCFILTKKGLVSVLVISPTWIWLLDPDPDELRPPHAAATSARAAMAATHASRRGPLRRACREWNRGRGLPCWRTSSPPSLPNGGAGKTLSRMYIISDRPCLDTPVRMPFTVASSNQDPG